MMSDTPRLTLNDGQAMPQLGFGTWQIADGAARGVVTEAIEAGFLAIDTAAAYGNETGVGLALADALSSGHAIFLTTKLANSEHGYESTLKAADASLSKLKLEALDLYLIHWPIPKRDRYVETWRAFIDLQTSGKVRSIGVSNFTIEHLQRLMDETGVVPTVNQIELHPRFQQGALRAFHARHGIVTQSWSPLGRGRLLDDPAVVAIAAKHGRTPAQAVIRWHIENGFNVIPKSVTPARIVENAAVFDFELDADDMASIATLDDPQGRTGPDPTTFG